MKLSCLFLLALLVISCRNQTQERAELLNGKLESTPILSKSFDSLFLQAQQLPPKLQAKILFSISLRNEMEVDQLEKQANILCKTIPIGAKKERKEILLQLITIYEKLNKQQGKDATNQCLKIVEELESTYSLSQEETWKVKRTKAKLLSQTGQQEKFLTIWYQLLKEHRNTNNAELIVDDLSAIATNFIRLNDKEQAIPLYKEAYQIAIDKGTPELRNQCLVGLINLLIESGHYEEVLSYYRTIGIDSFSTIIPTSYSLLAKTYLQVHKPDSARIYLKKMKSTSRSGNGMLLNCRFAETYIAENKEDSAAFYLNEAMNIFQKQNKKKGLKLLPESFLTVFSSFAVLQQQNGKLQQAYNTFSLMESLMTVATKDPILMKNQLYALTHYSALCRTNKQYAKALDLLVRRDSIRELYDEYHKKQESKSLINRLQNQEMQHTIDIQKTELDNGQRLMALTGVFVIILLGTVIIIVSQYHKLRKRLITIHQQAHELEELKTALPVKQSPEDPVEKLFLAAQKKIKSEKLFLQTDLKLDTFAKMMNSNRSYISTCINVHAGCNFSQWINKYRIEYAVKHFSATKDISEQARAAGFTSKSNFYEAFKQYTGMTPNQYLQDMNLNK